jgi:hypothetical protein
VNRVERLRSGSGIRPDSTVVFSGYEAHLGDADRTVRAVHEDVRAAIDGRNTTLVDVRTDLEFLPDGVAPTDRRAHQRQRLVGRVGPHARHAGRDRRTRVDGP